MRRLKKGLSLLLLIMVPITFSGCWNYREINEMAIVTALAIDKDTINNKFNIAVEIAHSEHLQGGGKISSKVFKSKGATIFEAVRDAIPELGRRGFWSHCKVVIISKTIAEGDISPVLDWVYRDQEPRRDIDILISKGSTAEEILYTDPELENTVGFELSSTIKNQKSTNRFPKAELGDIPGYFSKDEKSLLIPLVGRQGEKLNKTAVFGSAILKSEKVIGYLSGEDTFNALWIQGKVRTGTFVIKDFIYPKSNATIEIYNSSSKTRVSNLSGRVEIVVNISADVGLAELSSNVPFSKKEQEQKIKEEIEKNIAEKLTNTIKKVQTEYKADVFNFYNKVRIQQPKYYKKVSLNWGEEFSNLSIEVKADVHIRGSGVKSKPIKESD
jgi:spore germination protein KC